MIPTPNTNSNLTQNKWIDDLIHFKIKESKITYFYLIVKKMLGMLVVLKQTPT